MTELLRRLPLAVLVLGGVLVLASSAAVGTMAVPTVSRLMTVTTETMQDDTTTEVQPQGVNKQGSAVAATGTTCGTAVEATTGFAALRTAVASNSWKYLANVRESSIDSWPVGYYYRINVYADGVLEGTLYAKNMTSSSGTAVEGVAVTVDLGITGTSPVLPDTYNTVVTVLGATCS